MSSQFNSNTGYTQLIWTLVVGNLSYEAQRTLHQGGFPPFPIHALFSRHRLHISYVRRRLSKDMVQIVAKAHESKSLLQKLSDSRRSEQEDTKDHIVPLRSRPELV